jgi:beta-galactosidase
MKSLPVKLMLACAIGCSSSGFPEDFHFGAATAGFQIEMGCPTIPPEQCEDRASDWYAFVTSTVTQSRGSNHLAGDPPTFGPGWYELFEEDLDRAEALGLTMFRFSFEWSRLFPERGRVSAAAIEYYHRQIGAIRARGMTPFATLHHYTLPSWIHDAVGCNTDLARCSPKGWLEPTIVDELASYAGFVATEFGPDIDMWATQNEPFAVLLPGYIFPNAARTNPPAVSFELDAAQVVLQNMIDAHARMADAVHAADPGAEVGLVYAYAPIHPKDPSNRLDERAAGNLTHLFNDVFLDAVLLGKLDTPPLDRATVDRSDYLGRTDFLGVNYYTRAVVEGEEDSLFPGFSPLATFDPLTLQQGEVYPEGMYETLMALTERYPGVPLLVSENGVDVGLHQDTGDFLVRHLAALRRAMDEGADVRGYLWWSLMDNYEWNHGMNLKFGLYAVDPRDPTKARVARPIAETYREIIATRRLPE